MITFICRLCSGSFVHAVHTCIRTQKSFTHVSCSSRTHFSSLIRLFGLRQRRAPSDADFDPSDADAAYSSLVAVDAKDPTATATTSPSRSRRSSEASASSASASRSKRRSPSRSPSRSSSNEGVNVAESKDDSRQTFFVETFGLDPEERLLGREFFLCLSV